MFWINFLTVIGVIAWYGRLQPYFILGLLVGAGITIFLFAVSVANLILRYPHKLRMLSEIDRVKLETGEAAGEIGRVIIRLLME